MANSLIILLNNHGAIFRKLGASILRLQQYLNKHWDIVQPTRVFSCHLQHFMLTYNLQN